MFVLRTQYYGSNLLVKFRPLSKAEAHSPGRRPQPAPTSAPRKRQAHRQRPQQKPQAQPSQQNLQAQQLHQKPQTQPSQPGRCGPWDQAQLLSRPAQLDCKADLPRRRWGKEGLN